MLATGTHVLIRLKDGITLNRLGDFLPDGSYQATICGSGAALTVRVIEYWTSVAGKTTPELFCLITGLHDHIAYPATDLAAAYHWRWIGSETHLKEAKSTINGAGPSTGAMLRSASPRLIAQEHAAWITATELVRATARAAAAHAAPARTGRRAGQPVHPRDISFWVQPGLRFGLCTVDVSAVTDGVDLHDAFCFVDPVEDAVRATAGRMVTVERLVQRLADPARVVGDRVPDGLGGRDCYLKRQVLVQVTASLPGAHHSVRALLLAGCGICRHQAARWRRRSSSATTSSAEKVSPAAKSSRD